MRVLNRLLPFFFTSLSGFVQLILGQERVVREKAGSQDQRREVHQPPDVAPT
jgi:hypothetical protein